MRIEGGYDSDDSFEIIETDEVIIPQTEEISLIPLPTNLCWRTGSTDSMRSGQYTPKTLHAKVEAADRLLEEFLRDSQLDQEASERQMEILRQSEELEEENSDVDEPIVEETIRTEIIFASPPTSERHASPLDLRSNPVNVPYTVTSPSTQPYTQVATSPQPYAETSPSSQPYISTGSSDRSYTVSSSTSAYVTVSSTSPSSYITTSSKSAVSPTVEKGSSPYCFAY
eukprot:TRINITY_DN13094_c0_g1_i1.p2 TRINITY_DN13094_c0_g1~~TRINITY_DN13094_c0_g1_i1.p2  ORF type:complete len:227 (-),score=39.42 TRINITY_DN13094_c0_g1_i1:755-1435(-)